MASLTIRKLDEQTKARLRVRPARHGRSMEEEARTLLRAALTEDAVWQGNLADAIRARFRRLGGIEIRLPRREVREGLADPDRLNVMGAPRHPPSAPHGPRHDAERRP